MILEVNSLSTVFGYLSVVGKWIAQEVVLEVFEVGLCIWSQKQVGYLQVIDKQCSSGLVF